MSMNVCTFSGRLGSDPESRDAGRSQVCNFSIAVDRYKKEDGPIWIRVSAWGKLGELCQRYLTKGREVVVSGELNIEEWQGKTQVKLKANTVHFSASADRNTGPPRDRIEDEDSRYTPPSNRNTQQDPPYSPEDDDIPF